MTTLIRKILALLAISSAGQAADLIATGNWTQMVSAAQLVSGPGSNLPVQMQSMAGVTTLSISNAPGNWTLRVHRADGPWPSGLALFVKRTSAGSGSGTVSGGDSFVEMTGSDIELFSGSGPRSNIALQFRLTGLSVGVPPSSYLSSIVFSVQ
jgi:hypothetical protein